MINTKIGAHGFENPGHLTIKAGPGRHSRRSSSFCRPAADSWAGRHPELRDNKQRLGAMRARAMAASSRTGTAHDLNNSLQMLA